MLKKTLTLGMAAACIAISAPAFGASISYGGLYDLTSGGLQSDNTILNGMFSFDVPFGGLGNIDSFTPTSQDLLFEDVGDITGINIASFERVKIGNLKIGSKIGAGIYDFDPSLVLGGFQVLDDDGITVLFTADLTPGTLQVSTSSGGATSGGIISSVSFNLTGIVAGPGYVPTSSIIVDQFVNPTNNSSTIVTLNFAGDLGAVIDGG